MPVPTTALSSPTATPPTAGGELSCIIPIMLVIPTTGQLGVGAIAGIAVGVVVVIVLLVLVGVAIFLVIYCKHGKLVLLS